MLAQVKEWLRGDRRAPRDVLADLAAGYRSEVEAAAQLRAHAERVPYPQAASVLGRLAELEDRHAALLRRHIEALGGAVPTVTPELPAGPNHWARMADAFRRADEKRRRFLEQAIHWDIEYPEVAAVFGRIAREDGEHRRLLEELVTRADSLALD
jgi:rubrerythrin